MITDYCRGDKNHSQEFQNYVAQRGYDLRTVKEYGQVLKDAGFRNVQAIDSTERFSRILEEELKFFVPTKDAFIKVSETLS